MTQIAKTCMSVYYFDLLSYDDVSKYREEREYGWECRFAINDEEGDMVDLQSVREIADTSTSSIRMRDYNNFVASIDQFLRIYVSDIDRLRWLRGRTVES